VSRKKDWSMCVSTGGKKRLGGFPQNSTTEEKELGITPVENRRTAFSGKKKKKKQFL